MIRETAVETPAATLGRLPTPCGKASRRNDPAERPAGALRIDPGAAYERGESTLGLQGIPVGIDGGQPGFPR